MFKEVVLVLWKWNEKAKRGIASWFIISTVVGRNWRGVVWYTQRQWYFEYALQNLDFHEEIEERNLWFDTSWSIFTIFMLPADMTEMNPLWPNQFRTKMKVIRRRYDNWRKCTVLTERRDVRQRLARGLISYFCININAHSCLSNPCSNYRILVLYEHDFWPL